MNIGFEAFKGKRVLVTGNTGFKGSWMSIWLHELGAEVYGFALEPSSEMDNFVACKLEHKINQKYGDVRDRAGLGNYINEIQPEYIFHLAAQSLVIRSYEDPVETYSTNVMGVVNLLDASRNLKSLKSIVVITSDKCYENKEIVWGYRENDELGGHDPYSSSKGCAELVVRSMRKSFYQENGVAICSTRAGNVIGGGDWSDNRLIPDIFRSIRNGEVIDIRNPSATRPWEHVLEPLSGYMQLALWSAESDRFIGAWNFGPDSLRHYTVQEVVEEIGRSTDVKSNFGTVSQGPHEANLLKLDITKAATYLGWIPQLDFEETIRFTVSGYMAQDGDYLYDHRVKQIKEYTSLAETNKVKWAL